MRAQASMVNNDPQVPGPGLRRPAPKKVATSVAHCGAAALDSSWVGLAMLIVVLGALYVLLEVVRSVFDG